MSCPYHSDLAAWQEAIRRARDELLRIIDPLSRADLERARRGGWTVRKVLEHLIRYEQLSGQGMAFLAGAEAPERSGSSTPGSATEARTMLLEGRKTLLRALDKLDEDPMAFETFYELKKMGHEEYSVLSLLENVAGHDREHIAQIQEIFAADG
jgi:uncharacterized damage-inducible protein DinB